ncbi:MAG: AzlC family ABC transporter permease [Euzebya sp.]
MSQRHTVRSAVLSGARDLSPIFLGMAPFGLVAGIAAVDAGLPAWGASVYSIFVFAGASQLAALNLLGEGAHPAIIIGTVAIINARFLMYSASMATRFSEESLTRRGIMAYFLTDQAFAVTITQLDRQPDYGPRWAYYMGGAVPLWVMWQIYTLAGALAGSVIPPEFPLGFAVPLVFAALLVPAITDRPTLAAACTSALVAVVAADLPANLGLLVAASCGIAVGYTVSARRPIPTTVDRDGNPSPVR